jgi:K+-transporting ATPase KdpF subunit
LDWRKSWSKSYEPRQRRWGAARMSYDNIIGLALSVLLAVYLVAALFLPERF